MTDQEGIRASVILVSYNSKSDLERCLPSLFPTLGDKDEVIIVDNASTDGTYDWLEMNYPQIHSIHSFENLGFGGGNNLGAQYANGKFLVFLNPDTLVEHRWIDALIEALNTNSDVGLATSKVLLLNSPDRINTCGNNIHISGITLCRGLNEPASKYSEREEVTAISGTAFIIRRNLFDRLGGFDESFFMYMEDTDLSLRARLAGYKCLCDPQSVVYHDYVLDIGLLKTFYEERNRYIMLIKCFTGHTLLALLPTLVLAEIITWGFSVLHGPKNIINKIEAYYWIGCHRKEILRSRKQVQTNRKIADREILKTADHRLEYEQTYKGLLSSVMHRLCDPFFFIFKKFALSL